MQFELTREYIDQLKRIIEEKDEAGAIGMMDGLHPADIAEIYDELNTEEAKFLYLLLDIDTAADVLAELEEDDRDRFLKVLPIEVIAKQFIHRMDSDDAADVIGGMSEEQQEEILSHIGDIEQAGDIVDLLHYDEDTAGGLMAKELVMVNENWTVLTCLRELSRQAEDIDEIYYVYVVDDDGILKGTLSLKIMILSPTSAKISNIYQPDVMSVHTDEPDEEVARIMEKYDLVAIPVIDSIGRLMGRITIDDVVDVIRDEAEHTMMSMAGLDEQDDMFAPVMISARHRGVWLGINLLTALLASWVIGLFAETIYQIVILAILMPIVASMGGIAGIQTLTLVIRGIALGQIGASNSRQLLYKELAVSMMNGLLWATVVAVVVVVWFDDYQIGLVIAAAIIINLLCAAFAGATIPMFLRRIGADPALGGSVMLTTVTDVVGFVVFLGLATFFLL